MKSVIRLAQNRADAAANVEYLEGMPATTDREERVAYDRALKRARRILAVAEGMYANAVATYSDKELEAMGLPRAA